MKRMDVKLNMYRFFLLHTALNLKSGEGFEIRTPDGRTVFKVEAADDALTICNKLLYEREVMFHGKVDSRIQRF
ncbi:MAG: hypothetical protein ACYC69_02760 [Thermodesulfovibrionales bacterium]